MIFSYKILQNGPRTQTDNFYIGKTWKKVSLSGLESFLRWPTNFNCLFRLQLVEETCSDTGQHLMLRREKSFPQESEPKLCKISGKNASKQSKAINRYFEINDQSINEFDKITLMNQIKQDYIRRHVLNSSPKSDGNSSPHHSLSVFSPSVLFPVTTNSNLSRRKQMMLEQSKLNEEAASSCLYFFPSRKKEQAKLKKQAKEEKGKVRTVKSIMKIDQGNTSNLILNSEQFIQPPRLKTPLVLPPIHKSDLPQRFDKITLHDQSQAIVACDKSSNQCSLNLRKGQELRLSAYKRPMMLSIKNEFFK